MIVESIKWVSPASDEALVLVGDSVFQCTCCCQPCHLYVGQTIESPLFAFDAHDLRRSREPAPLLERRDGLGYRVVGELLSFSPAIVGLGEIRIELDAGLPGDLRIGKLVEFECERVDVIG